MSRQRHTESKRRFLGRVRRRPLKRITLLPSLVTLFNGIFGFIAIVFASNATGDAKAANTQIFLAVCMILLAMVADMLDGSLARMSQSTSSFGGQLDSLCDMVSFGLAPAFVMLKLMQVRLIQADLAYNNLIGRFLWLTAFAYISCAAIRLARFNVENVEQQPQHRDFVGLPSPAAAGVLVSYILFHQYQIPQWTWALWLLPVLAFATAGLMVSRIPYPHVVNHYLKGKKPFGHLIKVLVFLWIVSWSPETALVLIFGSFAASGVVQYGRNRWAGRREMVVSRPEVSDTPSFMK